MAEKYILKASPKAFVKEINQEEVIITSEYTKAIMFDTFGAAMEKASYLNNSVFESALFKVVSCSINL